MTIAQFQGQYRFLSNFTVEPCREDFTNEHFYQAEKTLDPVERFKVMSAQGPMGAKRAGRMLTLRPDWDQVRDFIMLSNLRNKFYADSYLRGLLVDTGDHILIEGNHWGDKYWGVDLETGEGENKLGILLMEVRAEVAQWTRV